METEVQEEKSKKPAKAKQQKESKNDQTNNDGVVRHHIIQAKMRFDFALPKDVPKENGEAYAKERLRHLIEKLGGLRGVEVTCIVE